MSIASEITRLQTAKAGILSAISAKGVTVPTTATLSDCPELISAISGGGGLFFEYRRVVKEVRGPLIVDEDGKVAYEFPRDVPHQGHSYPGNYALVLKGVKMSNPPVNLVDFLEFGEVSLLGGTYASTRIDNHEWLTTSLRYSDGMTLWDPDSPVGDSTPAYAVGPDGDYLYNSAAVSLIAEALGNDKYDWHVPSYIELEQEIISQDFIGEYLKSWSGWETEFLHYNGVDLFGFNARPTISTQSTGDMKFIMWLDAFSDANRRVAMSIDYNSARLVDGMAVEGAPKCYVRLCRKLKEDV